VVQVELGAKFVCWGKCEVGQCEIGDKRLGSCSIIFLNIKKKLKKIKNILWSKTIISRMIAHVPIPRTDQYKTPLR